MNYTNYTCSTGDRIDLIVLKHYKGLEQLNKVIAENKHLFKNSMVLKAGTVIKLPEFKEEPVKTKSTKREPLW